MFLSLDSPLPLRLSLLMILCLVVQILRRLCLSVAASSCLSFLISASVSRCFGASLPFSLLQISHLNHYRTHATCNIMSSYPTNEQRVTHCTNHHPLQLNGSSPQCHALPPLLRILVLCISACLHRYVHLYAFYHIVFVHMCLNLIVSAPVTRCFGAAMSRLPLHFWFYTP